MIIQIPKKNTCLRCNREGGGIWVFSAIVKILANKVFIDEYRLVSDQVTASPILQDNRRQCQQESIGNALRPVRN